MLLVGFTASTLVFFIAKSRARKVKAEDTKSDRKQHFAIAWPRFPKCSAAKLFRKTVLDLLWEYLYSYQYCLEAGAVSLGKRRKHYRDFTNGLEILQTKRFADSRGLLTHFTCRHRHIRYQPARLFPKSQASTVPYPKSQINSLPWQQYFMKSPRKNQKSVFLHLNPIIQSYHKRLTAEFPGFYQRS